MYKIRFCIFCLNKGKPKGCKECGRTPRTKRKTLKEQRQEQCEKEKQEWYKNIWSWRKVLGSGTGHTPLDEKVQKFIESESQDTEK